LLMELAKGFDSYVFNTYYHWDGSDDEKFKFGPVWDHDLSFGNGLDKPNKGYDIGGATKDPFAYVTENFMFSRNCGHGHTDTSTWFTRLWTDKGFLNTVAWQWKMMRDGALSDDKISAAIEYRRTLLKDAAKRDAAAWTPTYDKGAKPGSGMFGQPVPKDCKSDFNNPNHCFSPQGTYGIPYSKDFDDELDKLKTWIQNRAKWMDKAIPKPTGTAPPIKAVTPSPSKGKKTPAPGKTPAPSNATDHKTPAPSNATDHTPAPTKPESTAVPTEGSESIKLLTILSKDAWDAAVFTKDLAAELDAHFKKNESSDRLKLIGTKHVPAQMAGYKTEVTAKLSVKPAKDEKEDTAIAIVKYIESLNGTSIGNGAFKFQGDETYAPSTPSTTPAPSSSASVVPTFVGMCAALLLVQLRFYF